MAWLFLLVSGVLEVVWSSAMKISDGFTNTSANLVMFIAAGAGFWLLGIAMKTLPLGVAYPVWVGIGAVGAFTVGALFLGEQVSALHLVSVSLIVVGIAGLKIAG